MKTRVVKIGNVEIGGDSPIRIQSMTNTDTLDVIATSDQIMRLKDEGCEIARVTVQGNRQALACEKIKSRLVQKGYDIPLVADIHFFPQAALTVVDFVDKVRINPGNFVKDVKDGFLKRMEEELYPLIEKCKRLKRAMRIGTNHGSLSSRILDLYGNTSLGMVISALEYAEICRKFEFHDLVFSMKASNVLVMMDAYRLLVKKFQEKGWNYPIHLGVTEAGDEEDGIIKSCVGIAPLLYEGIGDTLRISLTADPIKEILPAKKLIKYFQNSKNWTRVNFNEIEDQKKEILTFMESDVKLDNVDALLENKKIFLKQNGLLSKKEHSFIEIKDLNNLDKILEQKFDFILFDPITDRIEQTRFLIKWLKDQEIKTSLILSFFYESFEKAIIDASIEFGVLLFEGIADGILIRGNFSQEQKYDLTFSILQACRKKLTKTEFIACPGCGRTLYDIQTLLRNVKEKTSHLSGLKIAIMGCVVNGLGEMADADFGVIGSTKDRVDLYLNKKCVERNLTINAAEVKLIELIKNEGKWKEK